MCRLLEGVDGQRVKGVGPLQAGRAGSAGARGNEAAATGRQPQHRQRQRPPPPPTSASRGLRQAAACAHAHAPVSSSASLHSRRPSRRSAAMLETALGRAGGGGVGRVTRQAAMGQVQVGRQASRQLPAPAPCATPTHEPGGQAGRPGAATARPTPSQARTTHPQSPAPGAGPAHIPGGSPAAPACAQRRPPPPAAAAPAQPAPAEMGRQGEGGAWRDRAGAGATLRIAACQQADHVGTAFSVAHRTPQRSARRRRGSTPQGCRASNGLPAPMP